MSSHGRLQGGDPAQIDRSPIAPPGSLPREWLAVGIATCAPSSPTTRSPGASSTRFRPRRALRPPTRAAPTRVRVTDREQMASPVLRLMFGCTTGASIVGVSGAASVEERPGLVAALAALRVHGAGVLVAAKRDRIARDTVVAAMVERAASKATQGVIETAGRSPETGDIGGKTEP